MTFSISARCPRTGAFGIAISSSSPAVAARCAHARADIGVVATQNVTDPRLGPRGLDILAAGLPADAALARLVAEAPHVEFRQLALVDTQGGSAVFSGSRALGRHGARADEGVAVAGNLLADENVLSAMLATWHANNAELFGTRLIAALSAGLAAGGEAGPVRSAGLLVVHELAWPVTDLRVDWHEAPIAALAGLWALWAPQAESYVARALDPAAAPAFGVPGDR